LMFDQLNRNSKVLQEQSSEQFLRFVLNAERNRKRWEQSELECQRLMIELAKADQEINGLEQKLSHARSMLDTEMDLRRKAETERDRLDSQLTLLRQLVLDDQLVDAVKLNRLRQVESQLDLGSNDTTSAPCTTPKGILKVHKDEESIVDVNDFSFDETKDLCESRSRLDRRSSGGRKRSRSCGRAAYGENILESVASPRHNEEFQVKKRQRRSRSVVAFDTEIDDVTSSEEVEPPRPRANSAHERGQRGAAATGSEHEFIQKTFMRSEKCVGCDKRIKFGKLASRCTNCRVMAHTECCSRVLPTCTAVVSNGVLYNSPVSRTPIGDRTRSPVKKSYFASPMLR